MDWLRQVPMGQYVDGSTGWLRRLDPRLKLAWSLVFLLTPVLAGPLWRVGLVVALVLITFGSGLARSVVEVCFAADGLGRCGGPPVDVLAGCGSPCGLPAAQPG